MMRRGFTIIELLVASLLLGMLMTILTMIFSQSSIAWRAGIGDEDNLAQARQDIATWRHAADAYYDWNGRDLTVRSIFDEQGKLLTDRQVQVGGGFTPAGTAKTDGYAVGLTVNVQSSQGHKDYVVNVKSAGPNRKWNDYDDIWSYPDDPNEW